MGGVCRCGTDERERVRTVPWQSDMCRICGGRIADDAGE